MYEVIRLDENWHIYEDGVGFWPVNDIDSLWISEDRAIERRNWLNGKVRK